VLLLLAAAILFAACAHRTDTAKPDVSGDAYVATKVCGFDLDGRRNEVRYRIELIVRRPLPRGSIVEVAFENPLDPATPLLSERVMAGEERDLQLVSPPVKGIREKPYEIIVRMYSSADRKVLLGTHTQLCEAPFSQRELGPEYR
jgi:hypothetical protein